MASGGFARLLPLEVRCRVEAVGNSSFRFLASLKNKGQLPGWSKYDQCAAKERILDFHYPDPIAFNHLLKKGESSI
jgi:hypothetical protein